MCAMQGSTFSAPPAASSGRPPRLHELRRETASKLAPPAIGLMIYFALAGLFIVGLVALVLFDGTTSSSGSSTSNAASIGIGSVMFLGVFALHALGFYGSLSMYRLQRFRLAVTAVVLACLPPCGVGWIFALVFAIWAAAHLFNGTTRYVFRNEMPPTEMLERPRSTNAVVIVLLVVLAVPFGIAVLGVGSALAIYGVRRYVFRAKTAEARVGVQALARGIAECQKTMGSLPPTTSPVPASLAHVAGAKYQSAPVEWQQPAFDCAGFRVEDPQYFQYSWELELDGKSGFAVARGDLDGDGKNSEYRVLVDCADECVVHDEVTEYNPLE
jgi:hypothetical protein